MRSKVLLFFIFSGLVTCFCEAGERDFPKSLDLVFSNIDDACFYLPSELMTFPQRNVTIVTKIESADGFLFWGSHQRSENYFKKNMGDISFQELHKSDSVNRKYLGIKKDGATSITQSSALVRITKNVVNKEVNVPLTTLKLSHAGEEIYLSVVLVDSLGSLKTKLDNSCLLGNVTTRIERLKQNKPGKHFCIVICEHGALHSPQENGFTELTSHKTLFEWPDKTIEENCFLTSMRHFPITAKGLENWMTACEAFGTPLYSASDSNSEKTAGGQQGLFERDTYLYITKGIEATVLSVFWGNPSVDFGVELNDDSGLNVRRFVQQALVQNLFPFTSGYAVLKVSINLDSLACSNSYLI